MYRITIVDQVFLVAMATTPTLKGGSGGYPLAATLSAKRAEHGYHQPWFA
jgi:hypothetical protein